MKLPPNIIYCNFKKSLFVATILVIQCRVFYEFPLVTIFVQVCYIIDHNNGKNHFLIQEVDRRKKITNYTYLNDEKLNL